GYNKLKGKKLIVFSVGSTPIEETAIEKVRQKNFSGAMIADGLPLFHLPGTIDAKKLSKIHRAVMVPIKNIIDKKAPEDQTDEDKDFLAIFSRPADEIDEVAAMAVVDAVKGSA
ncbi:MAG: hypothetical protein KAQ68_01825, partial [Clostridiales bacterium]|nr:hypothetical protein [Clostridiales bacterium]